MSGCWSPFFVAGAIASQLVPSVSALQLVALGLGMSAGGWALSLVLLYRGLGAGALAASLRGVATFAITRCVPVLILIDAAALHVITPLTNTRAVVPS